MPFTLPWQPRAHSAACEQLTSHSSPLSAHSTSAFLFKMSPAPSRINVPSLHSLFKMSPAPSRINVGSLNSSLESRGCYLLPYISVVAREGGGNGLTGIRLTILEALCCSALSIQMEAIYKTHDFQPPWRIKQG